MHDLEPIPIVELSLSPAIARHDVAIELDSHAVGLHSEDFQQRRESEGSGGAAEIALFPIDLKLHLNMSFIGAILRHLQACRRRTQPARDPSLRLKNSYAQDDADVMTIDAMT